MLVLLAEWLARTVYSGFDVFQYLTLRAILGVLTALGLCLLIGPGMIRRLTVYKIGQYVRDDGPPAHHSKAGTPTMGGALILVAVTVATLLWADLHNRYVWLALAVTLAFGAIGGVDDYRKLVRRNAKGLSARAKYFWQSGIGLATALLLYATAQTPIETQLVIPFVKQGAIDLGSGLSRSPTSSSSAPATRST